MTQEEIMYTIESKKEMDNIKKIDPTLGWTCPKCLTIINPSIKVCPKCEAIKSEHTLKYLKAIEDEYNSSGVDVKYLMS